MTKTKRAWDFLPEGKRQQAVKEIISYFKNERDEKIGTALEDIKKFLEEKFGNVVLDLDISLRK